MARTDHEPSSGNVFRDLDVPGPEEALAKAKLAAWITAIVARRRLTQAAAAAILGVDQPKVSALMRGHLTGFSTDRLLRFLVALGSDVEIVIRDRAKGKPRGRVTVVAA